MTYHIPTGMLFADDGTVLGAGYSGNGSSLNVAADCSIEGHGPIPPGNYTIGAPLDPPDHLGPLAMPLTPDPENEMYGRSGFYLHGDSAAMDHTASDGCIIMDRWTRQAIAAGADRRLQVAGE